MNRTLSISPEVERPGVPRHDVRRGARGLRRSGARPDRRRRRPPAARDDLRHAQRQGRHRRDRERVRGEGRAPAADDLGHDHRSQRPHAVGPDARRVLHLDPPRAAVQRRHQLRARRARHAPVPRGARAPRRVLRPLLPERRPAERVRRVRRAARRDRRRCCETFVAGGLVNIVGGCCGTTPDHIAAIGREVEGLARAAAAGRIVAA